MRQRGGGGSGLEANYSVTVREISDSPHLCELVWLWHRRRPGWSETDEEFYANAIGSDWNHFLFWVNNKPTACFSINKLGEHCYEVHTAAAQGASSRLVRQFALDSGTHMMADPKMRLVSKCRADHRAAVWLNLQFLTKESETIVDGETWFVFGSSAQEWNERHGQRQSQTQ